MQTASGVCFTTTADKAQIIDENWGFPQKQLAAVRNALCSFRVGLHFNLGIRDVLVMA